MEENVLVEQIHQKKSYLCVGLDTDIQKIPQHLHSHEDPVFEFNRQIIQATKAHAVAYKFNIAFYESLGPEGWRSLERSLAEIPEHIFTIADAKRGDIGNTSKMYAKTFFERYPFDSITVAPYMGEDSIGPFLAFEDKWVFVLGLTSNPGAQDFQYHNSGEELLYQKVIRTAVQWGKKASGHVGFVAGATRSEKLAEIRALAPENWLLVPGVGAQGGDLHAVCQHASNKKGGILINSSRGIIYASSGEDFASAAAQSAQDLQAQMAQFIR